MNSDPRLMNTGMVATTSAVAPPITDHFHRSDQRTTGSYIRVRTRLMGCDSSERMRPTAAVFTALQSHTGRNSKRRTRVRSPRDHEARRHEHRERLGVSERLEQPPFLRLECQHREERHGNHEQRVEARRRDLP